VSALVLVDAAVVGPPTAVPDAHLENTTAGATRKAVIAYEAARTRFTAPHDPQWLIESDSALAYLPADDDAYRSALAAVLREFDFGYLTPERARRLTTPTLVIWGEYDQVFPESMGRAVAASLPNARFEVITRTWHRPHEERPDETAAAILAFLASESGKSAPTP
jgi:pimeloyl-ACP methyl ester carboxylesterase